MVRSVKNKHQDYFEAVLQLRNVSATVMDYVYEEIDRGKVHIAKEVESKHGIDIYLSDNDFTKALGKKLQLAFGGEFNVTASLFSKKDGKDIYRLTALFRMADFKKDDSVEYNGEQYVVKTMGKDILMQNSKTGKKIHLKYKDMKQVKLAE